MSRGFADALVRWFSAGKRPLPFRDSGDAYQIWLSEILGQQTRMNALLPYYERYVERFPTVESLAAAEEDEVLSLWAGLGYYARARNLHKTARLVVTHYGGHFPQDYAALRALPGVGDYTAGAVCSIAFGMKTPAVDGNVRRVYARLTAGAEDDPAVWARALMEEAPPALVTEALMELGALLCVPSTPHCGDCPVSSFCRAHALGAADRYPVKPPKPPKREERVCCCLIRDEQGAVLLRRRTERLLGGLWEFPSGERLRADGIACRMEEQALATHRHVFTHIIWHMSLHHATLSAAAVLPEEYSRHRADKLPAFPSAMKPFAKVAQNLMERTDAV